MHFILYRVMRGNIINKIPKSLLNKNIQQKRSVTHCSYGGILPSPDTTPFGLLGIIGAVIPGLLIGATISKYMANFLEENELFVPSDDDDDDDDD